MRSFRGGELDEPVREPLHSHFGNVTLQLYPPLIKQDFYQQYHQPTFWPYCESLKECVVYRSTIQPALPCTICKKSQGIALHLIGLASLKELLSPSPTATKFDKTSGRPST